MAWDDEAPPSQAATPAPTASPAAPAPASSSWDQEPPPTSSPAPTVNPPEPDMSDVKKYITDNLKSFDGTTQSMSSPHDFFKQALSHALAPFDQGFKNSVIGLQRAQGKMPEPLDDEHADWGTRLLFNTGELAGNLPSMLEFGAVAGIAAGPVAGAAAGFAAPAMLRKFYIDRIKNGDIKDPGDFMQRTMGIAWEGVKGAMTGSAAELTGGLANSIAGPVAKFVAHTATMTTVGKALEGQFPKLQDFEDMAILGAGLHLTTAAPEMTNKLMDIFAKTGDKPGDVIKASQQDVDLQQQLASTATDRPDIPNPTENVQVKDAEGNVEMKKLVNPAFDEEMKEAQARTNDPTLIKKNIELKAGEPSNLTTDEEGLKGSIATSPAPEKMSIQDKLRDWYTKSYDATKNLKWAIDDVQNEWGDRDISPEDNSWIQSRLYAGHMDKVMSMLNDGTRDAKTGEINGEGINQIYKEIPDDRQDSFDLYSTAKRAIEKNDAGIEQPFKGFDREREQRIVDSGKKEFDDLDQRRTAFMNRGLQYAVDKGVLSQESMDRMVKANPTYIPLDKLMEPDKFGNAQNGGSSIPKIMTGADSPILNPRTQAYRNFEALIRRADINDIRQKAVDNLSYEDENGDLKSDFLEKVPAKMVPIDVQSQEISKALGDQGDDIHPDDITIFRPEKGYAKDNQIPIWEDGKRVLYQGDPGVIDSLKRLEGDKTSMDLTTKFLGGFAKVARVGQTADPSFGIWHAFRAGLMSGIYTETGQIPFLHAMLNAKEFMGQSTPEFKNWLYDGGAMTSWRAMDDQYIKNNLEAQEPDSPLSFTKQVWNGLHNALQFSEAFIKNTDNITRFTEYKRTLEQGGSRDQAAFNAREVTPDLQKAGIQRSMLKTGVAFLNAHIGALDRMGQEMIENPQRMMMKLSVFSAMAAMDWYVNKDDKAVQDLPGWRRYGFFNLNITRAFGVGAHDDNSGFIFSMPFPWAPGIVFGGGMKAMLDTLATDKPHVAKDFGEALLGSVVPPILPTLFGPISDQYANKNHFTGAPIVPTPALKALPEVMYQPYTSETAKQLGKLLGAVTGGMADNIGPKEDPLTSGAVVENYIRGWTGTVGGWALKIADNSLRDQGITPKNVGKTSTDTIADWPIMSRFLTRYPSLKTQSATDFYNNLDQTERALNTFKLEEKQGNVGAALALAKTHPDMEFQLSEFSKGIALDRKLIQSVQDNPKIEPTQKRQLIDRMIMDATTRMQNGNQMMDQFHKNLKGKE